MNRAGIKEGIDNLLYSTHNFIFDFLLFFQPKIKQELKRNLTLKDKHKGESCIILGNGPSLNNFLIEDVKDKKIFAVNYFYKNEKFKSLIPHYYILIDELFYDKKVDDMYHSLKHYPDATFFFKSKIIATECFEKVKKLNTKYAVTHNQKILVNDSVECDLTKNITASINVVNHCIQTAIYMGFSKIYLVGCDFNAFTSQKILYAYNSATTEAKDYSLGAELGFYSAVCYHHYALAKYAQKHNIQIINATPNSLLDAYPLGSIE